MSIFNSVTLTWKNKEYTIPPTQVLRAIAIVEDQVTLHELMQYQSRGTVPLSKLSGAFASVLRFAGAKVTDEEVYAAMFTGDGAASTGTAISALLLMMVPQNIPSSGSTEGNGSTGEARSSKKRMKQSSPAPAG